MEVDLLCADPRLAIELDGPQHLHDPRAYRRDRRKDTLLQEHGYFVLRFLTEDVGKHLDTILDTILRLISRASPTGTPGTTHAPQPPRQTIENAVLSSETPPGKL
jgi:very-short-patch-repair endonuclease